MDDSPLGLLDDEIAHYGFHGFSHFDTVQLTPKANWKLIVEGFLENWHFGILHRSTIAPIFIPSLGVVDSFDPHQRIVYPRRSILELRAQPIPPASVTRSSPISMRSRPFLKSKV